MNKKSSAKLFDTTSRRGFRPKFLGGWIRCHEKQAGIAGPGGEVPLSRVGGAQHPTLLGDWVFFFEDWVGCSKGGRL